MPIASPPNQAETPLARHRYNTWRVRSPDASSACSNVMPISVLAYLSSSVLCCIQGLQINKIVVKCISPIS